MLDQRFWSGKRVLVTGHTGFKGSWLALWLTQLNANVTGVSLDPETKPNLFSQLNLDTQLENHHINDIRDPKRIAEIAKNCNPEVVFHLAAQPLVRQSYKDPLGTWATNVQGTLNLLEGLRPLEHKCAVVMITTDKVYSNREWSYGYRETDRLGGHDPYSASKAAAEIAIESWRSSFCGYQNNQTQHLRIATARAGNVIGGGDWAIDRIVPDAIRSLAAGSIIKVRNPKATRPWQHVLEPLGGYLLLANKLMTQDKPPCEAFNFGPMLESNRTVGDLVESILNYWDGSWIEESEPGAVHEASLLHLNIDKAHTKLRWRPTWNFGTTVKETVRWYKDVHEGADPYSRTLSVLKEYQETFANE